MYVLQAIPGGPKPAPGVNVILDLVGASHFSANLQSLTIEGKLLLVGVPSGVKAEIDLASVSPACCFCFFWLAVMGLLYMAQPDGSWHKSHSC